jgi:hypothetical protein
MLRKIDEKPNAKTFWVYTKYVDKLLDNLKNRYLWVNLYTNKYLFLRVHVSIISYEKLCKLM